MSNLSPPTHKSEQTGNAALDRIQNNVRQAIEYLRNTFWVTRRAYVALTEDKSTASATFAELMRADLATSRERSEILITFHMSGSRITTTATTYFRFLVDGVVCKGCYQSLSLNYGYTASFQYRVPVTRGAHTVTVEWKTDAATTEILAATEVHEYATLHLSEEVSS